MIKVVVIGGGTGGISVASQLDANFEVTVIEKSTISSPNFLSRIPLAIGLDFQDPRQTHISSSTITADKNREIPFFTSKLLGGASVINGSVHTIGSQELWLRTFRALKIRKDEFDSAVKKAFGEGRSNSLKLKHAPMSLVDECFESAAAAFGIPTGTTSIQDKPSVGRIVNTCGRIFRSSVLDLINKKRVNFLMGQKVVGFDISSEGRIKSVLTDEGHEIAGDVFVLSGGVYGSCEALKRLDDNYKDKFFCGNKLGKAIADHINVRINVKSKVPFGSLNEIWGSNLRRLGLLSRHLIGFDTLMSGTGATTALNLDLDDDGVVDTRINMLAFSETGRHGQQGQFLEQPGFSLSISSINPKSRGALTWDSHGLRTTPNYLASYKDRYLAKAGLLRALDLLESKEMGEVVEKIWDANLIRSEPARYIKSNFYSGHHLIGGTAQIVKNNFRVGRLKNLYVCDASILSSFPASNIHAPVVILGTIFGNRLREQFKH